MIAQLVLSCLVPLALGLLGAAAYGRRTALLAVVFGSLYFPFIEYGALFLTELHLLFWLALAFAGFMAAHRASRRGAALAFAAGGGLALSIAATFKTLALPPAVAFIVVDGVAHAIRRSGTGPSPSLFTRMKPWLLRGAVLAIAAAPVLGVMSRVCTRASGHFCVTGKEMGHDLLLGHFGRIADVEWGSPGRDEVFRFGSPSSYLRNYERHIKVPFPIGDAAANRAEAWRWISANPGEAIVLSLDHVYDTLFGPVMWPTMNSDKWPLAAVSQFVFIVLLFVPTVLAAAFLLRRGLRAALVSRTALMLAPIGALMVTVMVATGEVRYRIPFDIFFITIACAYLVGDLARVDGPSATPSETDAARSRS